MQYGRNVYLMQVIHSCHQFLPITLLKTLSKTEGGKFTVVGKTTKI